MTVSRRWPAAAVTLFVFIAPVMLWAWSTGNPAYYLQHAAPPGQGLYVASRLLGLIALSLFWFQAMTALARGVPRLQGFFLLSPVNHRRLGLSLFGLVIAHVLLFFLAVSLRTGHVAYGVLIPDFEAGFYRFYVSLGVIALALLPLGIAAGYLRRRLAGIRWLHRIWPVVFALVFLHGVNIGTETRIGLMFYVYLLMAVSLVAAATLRAVTAWRRTRRGQAASDSKCGVNGYA